MTLSPVADGFEARVVRLVELLVRNGYAWCRIRIEIVVDMESVDIVACYDVFGNLADIVAVFLQRRIEDIQSVELKVAFGMLHADVLLRQDRRAF